MKRKHPNKVEGSSRSAKKPQHDPAVTEAWGARSGSGPQGSRTRSITSSERSYGLQSPQQQLNEVEIGIDDGVGRMDVSETLQQQLDFDVQHHRTLTLPSTTNRLMSGSMNAEKEAAHSVGNWLIQQPSMSRPRRINSLEQDPAHLEHNLLLEQSSFGSNAGQHFSDEMQLSTNSRPVFTDMSSNGGSPRSYLPDGFSSRDVSYLQDTWFPSPSQTARGYHLYFTHVTNFVPFVHRPTFDATETARHLGLSMLCIAYQYGEDPDCGEQAGSGASLSMRCFHRARVLAAAEEETTGDLLHRITLVQTYWLLQVCVMMYLCGEDSAHGLKMHSRMISLARFGGLTQAMPIESTTIEDLDALWHDFITAESQKRTLLAVHQIDALWYQLFSIPRSLSHLEIKHDLPCREEYWTASSSAQWAHRQLAAKQPAPLVSYSDAVRCFLAPDPDIDSLPSFDLYGAVNIAQFLLSSAREVSGWSTMTGRLSLERFELLRSSLIALERLIRPQGETAKSTHALYCEATWEIAMVELLIWSPAHTCGIIGGSVDAFLSQSTYLASSSKIVNETVTVSAVQPHIDWFLRYLDTTLAENSEPPWIDLYAYKAFLIAWQFLKEGVPGAMQAVGLLDGDVHGAIVWARKAFQRRQRQQLSALISSCLDILDT